MALQNTYTNWSKKPQQAQRSNNNAQFYISEYEKHRRYYFRDYDDRYQVDTQQQFEVVYGKENSHSPHALHIPK